MRYWFNILKFVLVIIVVLFTVNGIYQVFNKPAELVAFFHSGKYKSSSYTWQVYEDEFKAHETKTMSRYFLAALSQVESAGNPIATPKWRWQWTLDIRRIYAPASSSVGLFQYTKPTLKDAKRFCIHWGESVTAGAWLNWRSCWFNSLYTRFSASDSIEMTSGRLDHYVNKLAGKTSLINKEKLASVIHLCGLSKGKRYIRDGFRFKSFKYCGRHNAENYVNRVQRLKNSFKKM